MNWKLINGGSLIKLLICFSGLGDSAACAEDAHTATACFSADTCGFFKLECPHGHVIKIETLSYGWKTLKDPLCANISTNCAHSNLCCSYHENDTLKDFTQYQTHGIYQQCSGKRKCADVRATRTFLNPSIPESDTLSTYVVVRYTCSNDVTSIDFCEDSTIDGKLTNLIFNQDTATLGNLRQLIRCTCLVQSNMTFNASLVDGRLGCSQPKLYCDPPVIYGLSDIASPCVSASTELTYFYHNKDYGSGQGPEFNITFDTMCPPHYMWLQLRGTDSLHVRCNRRMLREITTTTTSTTTTTTTTTTIATTTSTGSLTTSIASLSSNSQSKSTKTSNFHIRSSTGNLISLSKRTTQYDHKSTDSDRQPEKLAGLYTETWIAIGAGVAGIVLVSCISCFCWRKRAILPKTTKLQMEYMKTTKTTNNV